MGMAAQIIDTGSFRKAMIEGMLPSAGPMTKGTVVEIVSAYHLRTGKFNNDGSVGEIKISPLELSNLLVYVMARYGVQEALTPQE